MIVEHIPHNVNLVSDWDVFFVLCNSVLALIASIYNFKAFRYARTFVPRLRFMTTGLLAAGYSISYSILGFSNVQVTSWSSIMRGVSLVAWIAVWLMPARHIFHRPEVLARAIADEVNKGIHS